MCDYLVIAAVSWGWGDPRRENTFSGGGPLCLVSNIRLPTQRPTGQNRRRNLGTRTEGVGQGGERKDLFREGSGSLGIQGISSVEQ